MSSSLPLTRSLSCRRVAFAKLLVRSSWSPADWTASALQSRGWPLPRLSDSGLQRLSLHEATQLDLARPAVIGGALREWPDPGSWELPSLLRDHATVDCLVGLDDEGVGVELRLDDFAEYAASTSDDLPLYIFDEDLLDTLPALAAAYAVPSCFPQDLLSLCGSGRPPHRWVLIGPERAGTEPHVDPHQSAAWNTLVTGTKRWFFFPPRDDGGGSSGGGGYGQDDEGGGMAAAWLHERYPLLTERELAGGIECVQEAGETVYVPNGWTHAVVNLSMSIAVTHNFVGTHNVAAAAAALLEEEPRLARQWIVALAEDAALRQLLPPSLVVMADSDRLCDTEFGSSSESEEDGGHDEVCRVQRFLRHRTNSRTNVQLAQT